MAEVKLCVRATERDQADTPRGCRAMHVLTPASSGDVLVYDTDATPHRTAVLLHLRGHGDGIRSVELFERVTLPKLTAAGMGPLWSFVVTLELTRD